jgi:hypothetical protein
MLGEMANRKFSLSDQDMEVRLRRLDGARAEALESVLSNLAQRHSEPEESLLLFLLPLVETGLSAPQILSLLEKVPDDFPQDHRRIYFDFRLARWIKHIEPPSFREIMEEYLEHSPTKEAGLGYLEKEWAEFLDRHSRR